MMLPSKRAQLLHNHPRWVELATRYDNLSDLLLKYGDCLSGTTLKAVQEDFAATKKEINELEKKLGDEGWMEMLSCASRSDAITQPGRALG